MFIIGERYRSILEESAARIIRDKILWLPDNPSLDPRLAGHADLSVFTPEGRNVFVGEKIHPLLVNTLTNRGYNIILVKQDGSYPDDASLCVCCTGSYTIYSRKTIYPAIRPYLNGVLIDVPQGYTRCSVCIVTHRAIITSDDIIAERAAANDMDVLKIHPGYIVLEGFPYGFIGGASFLIDSSTLALTGTLENHPDRDAIEAFLRKHCVRPVYLTKNQIFDIGGAVTLP